MIKTFITAVILCTVEFLSILIMCPMAKPKLVLSFLPEDIREAARDHPEPAKWKQCAAHFVLLFFIATMLGGIIYLGMDGIKNGYGFWKLAGRFILLLYLLKLYDIVVQDQWLVMSTDYFKKIFPETKDCKGWNDRHFNDKNQIVRLIAYPFCALATAGIFMLFR